VFFHRHCFWILGDAATLSIRKTIWQEIVDDAKERGCFYNGNGDKDLSAAVSSIKQKAAVSSGTKKNEVDNLPKMDTRLGISGSRSLVRLN
jgi:senataxin